MKTKIILLTAALALGTGCKGNGDATKAATPSQLDQYNRDHREHNALNFLDRAHKMRRLVSTQGSDLRVIGGRLLTAPGDQGSYYDLKVRFQDEYGGQYSVQQEGHLIPKPNFDGIEMFSRRGGGAAHKVGTLTLLIDMTTNDQCVLLDVHVGGPAGLTRVMFCEESANRRDDRRDDRRRY